MNVTWNDAKNRVNARKHGITFEEAAELFWSDGDYLEVFDEEHSVDEDRFIAIGAIARGVVLVVWTEADETTIRLISARWATRAERELLRKYLEGRR